MNRIELSEACSTRLFRLLIILNRMDDSWDQTVFTSAELGKFINSSPETVRKDLNTLGVSASGRGYKASELAVSLKDRLNLNTQLSAGLYGLDSWGSVVLKHPESFPGIRINAAFDSSQNRIERTESTLPLYPSYEITEVFEEGKIRVGILASESGDPQRILERMIRGGASGIINLTSCPLKVPGEISYHQADLSAGCLSMVSRINGLDNRMKPRGDK